METVTPPPPSTSIRVDGETYAVLLARKHELEEELGHVVSMDAVLRDLLQSATAWDNALTPPAGGPDQS